MNALTKEEAVVYNSNLDAGYLIFCEPVDFKPQPSYNAIKPVRIVIKTPSKTIKGSRVYSQSKQGQDETAKEIKRLNFEIYSKRQKAITKK